MRRAAAGVAALTAAAGCAAYAQLGLRSPPGGGGGASGGPGGRTHRRGPGNSGGGDVAFSRTRRGALTLDEVHVAYLDAVESAQGHRGVALATVINDAGSRAADEGGADEVFNTPRCAVRSSPGSPKGKKRKVRRPERRLGARRHAPSCVLTRHVAFA